MHTLIHVKCC